MRRLHVFPLLIVALVSLTAAACPQVTPPEKFSRACATSTEAMLAVNIAYDRQKLNQSTYDQLADTWLAVRQTCQTLPTDGSEQAAMATIQEFLQAAGVITGTTYAY